MSELSEMARPLVERSLVEPPPMSDLRRRSQRRRRQHLVGTATSVVMVAVVVALVVALLPGPSNPAGRPAGPDRLAAFIQAGVSVPDSVLQSVGLPPTVTPPTTLAGQPTLTDGGKAAVVYVGGEFCPYCALQRWALVVALSRFGAFSNLGSIVSSSSTDVFPGLQSWSFHGSSYASSSLTFDPAEVYSDTATASGSGYQPLDTLSPLQRRAFDAYDHSGPGGPGGAIPFVDVANRFVLMGASSSPAVLEGLSLDQVAADLSDPSSPVAQAVDGTANYLVAALCQVTGVGAAPICSSPVVAQAQARMARR